MSGREPEEPASPGPSAPSELEDDLAAFLERNAGFNLLTHDFCKPDGDLDFEGVDHKRLLPFIKARQRLQRLGTSEAHADALIAMGLDSAHTIASRSERRFLDEATEVFGTLDPAREVYRKAVSVKGKLAHIFANVRHLVASPHTRAHRFHNAARDLIEYFEDVPSYQDLFGSLDYLVCPQCQSLLSPAAYFEDLMRLAEEYITYPNRFTIPPNMRLEDRRPDLFDIELTCDAVDNVVPFLRIVNDVLVSKLTKDLGTDPIRTLACAAYPFNLPFLRPLAEVRAHLAQLGVTLPEVYAALDSPLAAGALQGATPTSVTLAADASQENGYYVGMVIQVTPGQGPKEHRRVVAYDGPSRTATVVPDFAAPPAPGSTYVLTDSLDLAREQLELSLEQYAVMTTTDDTAAGVSRAYGYDDILTVLYSFAPAPGTISFSTGTVQVTGTGVDFSALSVGDRLLCDRQIRSVARIRGVDALDVDSPWTTSVTGAGYRAASWPLGLGTITVRKGSRDVSGAGTTFSDLNVGDQIQCVGAIRTITNLFKDALRVDAAWDQDATGVPYTVNRASMLERVDVFLRRTGTTRDRLAAVLSQDLSPKEIVSGAAGWLFINDTGEPLPPLQMVTDMGDPAAPYSRIVGLSLARLDRLSRFIRLQAVLGWSPADVDWLLRTVGGEIGPAAVEAAAATLSLCQLSGLTPTVVMSFWYDMKTIGWVRDTDRRDLFDRVYNDPTLLHGQDPYTAPQPIPFDPDRPIVWTIAEQGAGTQGATVRSRLLGALRITDDELTNLALAVASLEGAPTPAAPRTLRLNLPALSWLFRLVQQAKGAGIPVGRYLTLLRLVYHPEAALPPPKSIPATAAGALELNAYAAWVRASPFDYASLLYILAGHSGADYRPSYGEADLRRLVNDAALRSTGALVTEESFPGAGESGLEPAQIIATLVAEGIISELGIVLDEPVTYGTVAFSVPVTPQSFVAGDIDQVQSEQAYVLLLEHDVLVALTAESASLSESFDASTSLEFLFPGLPDAPARRTRVREVLLMVKAEVLANLAVVEDARSDQEGIAVQALAEFTGLSQEMIPAAVRFTLGATTLGRERQGLLSPLPPDAPVPSRVTHLVDVVSRAGLWISPYELPASFVQAVAGSPAPFGIADPRNLTLAGLRALSAYTTLASRFGDQGDGLLAYLLSGDLARLADLTGWPEAQLVRLVQVLWPPAAAGTAGSPATVDGVSRLAAAFDIAASTGLDAFFLLDVRGLLHRSVGPIGGPVSEDAWRQYRLEAERTLDAVGARYGEDAFRAVAGELSAGLDGLVRDVLVGLVVWVLGKQDLPVAIETPDDLYQFLLLDVEMGPAATTSLIAQGISSVQLYLQRARMNLEVGVVELGMQPEWWEWSSSYVLWEANRQVFLFPENYLRPGLRSGQTPLFEEMSQRLLQSGLSPASVADAFAAYFGSLAGLANLKLTGAYQAEHRRGETDRSVLHLLGRAETEPYAYYLRTHDDLDGWSPWRGVDLSIASPWATPAVAFDRPFLFWAELSPNRTATVAQTEQSGVTTDDRVVIQATLRFSFQDVGGRWAQPQVLAADVPTEIGPDTYAPLADPVVRAVIDNAMLCWRQPYPLRIARGLVGTGRVEVTAGSTDIIGNATLFLGQVRRGDRLYCGGETRTVREVVSDQILEVDDPPWTISLRNAQYKVIPFAADVSSFPPFTGPGTVSVTKNLPNVFGVDTDFVNNVAVGDRMVIAGMTRRVEQISGATELMVDRGWDESLSGATYRIVSGATGEEQLVVLFGGPLPTWLEIEDLKPPPTVDNPGKDNYLAQRQAFDFSLFYALTTAEAARASDRPGTVTVSYSADVDLDLNSSPERVLLVDYGYGSLRPPRPFRVELDAGRGLLRALQSDNVVVDNYWGNRAAGTPAVPPLAAASYDLLFNVSGTHSALLNVGNQVDWFLFDNGDESFIARPDLEGLGRLSDMVFAQGLATAEPDRGGLMLNAGPYSTRPVDFDKLDFQFTRSSTATIPRLQQRLLAGGVDALLTLESQRTPELPFTRFYADPEHPPPHVKPPPSDRLDFDGAYGNYFQEVFLFAPWLVAERLAADQQFESALRWMRYIFDPMARPVPGEDEVERYWRYLPFRNLSLQKLADALTDDRQITAYNDHPFDPDAIARLRPGAYAKAVVLFYVSTLLDRADAFFAADTRESIDQATQLYVLAADLLGPRPQAVGEMPPPTPVTFAEIRAKYGQHIPQFLIDLENAAPALAGVPGVPYAGIPFNDVRSYFCIPENASLIAYWDRVEDRMFKIRHGMNVEGVERPLALFEPTLAPGQRVARGGMPAAGAGAAPMPNYRFSVLVAKAREFTAQVSQLSAALLATLEKRDAEALAGLRTTQEQALLTLTTLARTRAVEEASATGTSLGDALASARARKEYYEQLLTEGLSSDEVTNLEAMQASLMYNILAQVGTTAAAIGYAVPQVGSPFAMTYGGQQIGSSIQAAAGVLQIGSEVSSYIAQRSLTMAGYRRREQEWDIQARLADLDIEQVTAQVSANSARVAMLERELEVHLQAIAQSRAIGRFLTTKFTNTQLYDWMASRLSALHYQAYLIAFGLARSAERAFQFELNSNQTFLDFGYWDGLRKGLVAADGLLVSLTQMEKAYLDQDVRRLDIERTISVLQLDPKALLDLRTKGECTFSLTERLFDQDYPGHYRRTVRSVSISIPAVFGPYQNVKATLTQLSNQVLLTHDIGGVEFLLGSNQKVPSQDVLRSNWRLNQAIALSSAARDSGVFELSFGDRRYLPFEGTGAVSTWRLSMPPAANRFAFPAIADVIIDLQYSALDGGRTFRNAVVALPEVAEYRGSPLIDMAQNYSDAWYEFLHVHVDPNTQTLRFQVRPTIVPPHVEHVAVTGFLFALRGGDAEAGAGGAAGPGYITLDLAADLPPFDFALDARNVYTTTITPVPIEQVLDGERTIRFTLDATPQRFRSPDGYLNPDAVRDIALVLYYTGRLTWP